MGIRGEFGRLCSRVDISDEMIERRQKAINEAFPVTLTQVLVATPRMRATMEPDPRAFEPVRLGHHFATGGAPQFGITKEDAVNQIGALTRDRDFIKRDLSEDHEATVKMKALHAAAHRQASP
jgi:hypothetical protein